MCGIAGYIGEKKISQARIESCLALMARRGPDNAGVYSHSFAPDRHVHLLHSRLSILDLDPRSNQPFRRGQRSLIFNGEIYNYLELKKELAASGHEFTTASDTEVLLETLIGHGVKGLDRCEGMWAFACYNEADGSLLLSRDRFGEKPLFLCRRDQGLYFASEVKFITALLGRKLAVNYNHLYRYLVYGFRSLYKGRETFFKGVSALPAGTTLLVRPGGVEEEKRYWTPAYRPEPDMTFDEAVRGAREQMIRSVEIRLRADVPLAFCMSGGVDSNSLISIAKRVFDYDVHGFTFSTTDARYDELDLIRESVAELGVRHTVIPARTESFLPRLRELMLYHDAPVHTITWFANWLLLEAIAGNGYRVSLSGVAADEMFSGYYDHHLMYLYEVRGDPALHSGSLRAWRENIRPVVRSPLLRDSELFVRDPAFRGHLFMEADGFAGYLKADFEEAFEEHAFTDNLMRNRMLNELFMENVPVYVHEEDLNAMYFSVENRSPYLDRGLFEFCYRIPSKLLVRNGRAKAVLREAMRGIVPDAVLDCPVKVGFNAPIYAFLDVNDPEVRACVLDDGEVYGHVSRERMEALIQKTHLSNNESKFLFSFLNCKMFLEEFA